MAANAQVIVELVAQTAKFESDMKRVSADLKTGVSGIQKTFAALGVTLSVGAFAAFIKGAIDAADRLNDLSKKTGVAATVLGGIGFAAQQAGADTESVVKAFGKLNLSIEEAASGKSPQLTANFKALGIGLKELNSLNADEIFLRVAAALEKYADGPRKAAIVQGIFKKSYQEMLPLLDEGAAKLRENIAYWQKYSGVTEEVVKQADEFNDTLAKIKLLSSALGTEIAAKLLPSMQGLANEFLAAKEQGDAFSGAADDIVAVIRGIAIAAVATATELSALGHALGAIAAEAAALAELDFKRIRFIEAEAEADQNARYARMDRLIKAIQGQAGTELVGPPAPSRKPKAPRVPDVAAGIAEQKGALEKLLREQDIAIAQAQDRFKNIGTFIEEFYKNSLIGLQEYFDARAQIVRAGLAEETRAYDEKIRLLQDASRKADPKERLNLEKQLEEVIAARAKVENNAAYAGALLEVKRTEEAKKFLEMTEDITIALARSRGEEEKAATLSYLKSQREIKEKITANLGSADPTIRAQAERAKAELQRADSLDAAYLAMEASTKRFGQAMVEVGILQQQIDLKAQTGAVTTIDALNQKAAIAARFIPLLELEAQKYEAIAASVEKGSPAAEEARLKVLALRLEIDQLKVSSEALEKTFRDVFETSFADALVSAIDGTKSLSEAFKAMEKSIVASISRIAAQNISEALFGKSGALGGGGFDIAAFMAKLFGAGAGGYATGPGMPQLGGPGGGLAGGTDSWRGGSTWVGERGPEIVNLPRGSQVIPAEGSKRLAGTSNVFHINVLPGASRASAAQAAAAAAREARVAAIRNG